MTSGIQCMPAGYRRFVECVRLAICLVALAGALAGCGAGGPPVAEYVLGGPAAAATATTVETGLPVVEATRVLLPDYLNTTDIVARSGGQVIPSRTGRWAERLSVNMTRALTASLSARLQGVVVTSAPVQQPTLRVLTDVAAFEPAADRRQVVLVARWSIADGASRTTLTAEQASLVEPVVGTGDGAVVAAMSEAVEHLADRIAAGIQRDRRLR